MYLREYGRVLVTLNLKGISGTLTLSTTSFAASSDGLIDRLDDNELVSELSLSVFSKILIIDICIISGSSNSI